jgi:hypothetical protein
MRRAPRVAALIVGTVLIAFAAAAPAQAQASTSCSAWQYPINRGGYGVELDRFRTSTMNCASVRYVARFLARKLDRQYGWPHITGPFYDGYVTWRCDKLRGHRWSCLERSSFTSFSFRGQVWP